MTEQQKKNYNKMLQALTEINNYQSPDSLRNYSEDDYGLEYEEALEMAYENIQYIAKQAVKNVSAV